MHGTADNVADGDSQKRDGPEQNALDRPKDGTGTCNVQQVDQAVLPALHGDIVNAVLFGIGGRLAVVRPEDLFAETTIEGCAADQDDQTDDECQHKTHSPL